MMDIESKPVSDELLKQIGRVSVNFSTLETVVSLGVWGLLGTGQRVGVHVTSGMQFKNLLDLFSRLATQFAAATEDLALERDIAAFRRGASSLADRRNAILHSMWMNMEPHSVHPWRGKPGRKLPHFEEVPVSDVTATADQIRLSVDELGTLLGRLPHIGPPEEPSVV